MLSVCALLIVGVELAISQDISHLEHQIIWGEGPSHLWKMNERIEKQAQMLPKEVSESGAIKRLAFFDIAFPSSPQEFVALDGNGVILVTAISHDSTELPLKKVHVKAEDENIELKEISYALSKDHEKSLVTKTFG